MSNKYCSLRSSFINRDIDEILLECLTDIRETLYKDADFVKTPSLFIYSDYGIPLTLYPGADKAKELDDFLYDIIIGRGSRGVYRPDLGRIFLKRGAGVVILSYTKLFILFQYLQWSITSV